MRNQKTTYVTPNTILLEYIKKNSQKNENESFDSNNLRFDRFEKEAILNSFLSIRDGRNRNLSRFSV